MILLQGYERPTQFISNHPRVYLSFISGHLPFGTVFQRPSTTNSKRQRPLLSRTVTQTIRETNADPPANRRRTDRTGREEACTRRARPPKTSWRVHTAPFSSGGRWRAGWTLRRSYPWTWRTDWLTTGQLERCLRTSRCATRWLPLARSCEDIGELETDHEKNGPSVPTDMLRFGTSRTVFAFCAKQMFCEGLQRLLSTLAELCRPRVSG